VCARRAVCVSYLERIAALDPRVRTQRLLFPLPPLCTPASAARALRQRGGGSAEGFNPHVGALTRGFVDAMRARGRTVCAWTVDSELQMAKCVRCGVHGIITNEPARARAFLAALGPEAFRRRQQAQPVDEAGGAHGGGKLSAYCHVAAMLVLLLAVARMMVEDG
jgi:hypothetical protein